MRSDIDGLPFTEEGYSKAKDILEAEYGQSAEVVNAYIVNINNLPVISGADPAKIHEFYKQLRYNVQSLETLDKLHDVRGNVRATLEKLKGIKSDLVRGNEGWQEWSYHDLLKELKKWKDINPIEEKSESKGQQKGGKSPRSKFFHAKDFLRERECVCKDTTHKSTNCTKGCKKRAKKENTCGERTMFQLHRKSSSCYQLQKQNWVSEMQQKAPYLDL